MGDVLLNNFYNVCSSSYLSWPSLRKFSGTDPDQDAKSFIQLYERKIIYAPGVARANPDVLAKHSFRKKTLFSCLLKDPAGEWYESNFDAAIPWEYIGTNFISRLPEGRNKFRHRLEIERCIKRDGEEIENSLKKINNVDKSWPDDISGVTGPQQAAEQAAEARQKRERYKAYCLRGLRPIYLQRKAQEYLLERPNATGKNFCTQIIQKDLILEVSSTF